ncbi:type I-F CRISPR-associated protein Csy1 [Aromatoleum anaerobium]|uniref:Uncharacterized protein n=1 Tax=Aromatoleum anaerobium TaxID=182180 RepID=A0ABX1PQL9_9RHOO
MEDTARSVAQIQAVIHTLKSIHFDTRGTDLLRARDSLGRLRMVNAELGQPLPRGDIEGREAT